MDPKSVIVKGSPLACTASLKPSRSAARDPVSSLPAEVLASILDLLPVRTLRQLHLVHPSWSSFFHPNSPMSASFRYFTRRRFGSYIPTPPLGWPRLYLSLRCERCRLCPAPDVAPCVYAGSAGLAMLGGGRLVLFPVCTRCWMQLKDRVTETLVPVVERAAVAELFGEEGGGEEEGEEGQRPKGVLYSEVRKLGGGGEGEGVEYVLVNRKDDGVSGRCVERVRWGRADQR